MNNEVVGTILGVAYVLLGMAAWYLEQNSWTLRQCANIS